MNQNLDSLKDEDLLRLMSSGIEDAFTTLYRRRQGGVYRFALQMSGSASVAEDVTQEVFLALIRDAKGFDAERGSLAGYIYGIARNQVLRRIEKDRVLATSLTIDDSEDGMAIEATDPSDGPLDLLSRTETVETVRNAVLALPAHYREVIVFCELQEMSYFEAAEALGCAVGTVRSRLHRARTILVEKLKGAQGFSESREGTRTLRCFA